MIISIELGNRVISCHSKQYHWTCRCLGCPLSPGVPWRAQLLMAFVWSCYFNSLFPRPYFREAFKRESWFPAMLCESCGNWWEAVESKSRMPAEALSHSFKFLKLRRTFVIDVKTKIQNLVSKSHSCFGSQANKQNRKVQQQYIFFNFFNWLNRRRIKNGIIWDIAPRESIYCMLGVNFCIWR